MKWKLAKIRKWLIYVVLLFSFIIATSNYYINNFSKNYISYDIASLPKVKYGLLLGTSKYFKKGEYNNFYAYRVDAAYELLKSGKIDKIIISGTHEDVTYSEPLTIKSDLIKKGIADSLIILDFFGDRTLLSISNFKSNYKGDSLLIISQKFHNQRAVYIARNHRLNAWGYNANDVEFSTSYKVLFRELFAKTKAVFE